MANWQIIQELEISLLSQRSNRLTINWIIIIIIFTIVNYHPRFTKSSTMIIIIGPARYKDYSL